MRKMKRFLSMLLVFCLITVPVLSNVGCVIVHAEVNWLDGDAQDAMAALNAFLSLETSATKDELMGSLTTLQGYIQEDKKAESGFSNAISYLEDESKSDEFAAYLLDWITTWREDPDYRNEVEREDSTTEEGVDRALECVMCWTGVFCYRYEIERRHMLDFLKFVDCCKKVLPASQDNMGVDYTHEVTDAELDMVNQYAKDIYKIYGGKEFIDEWCQRDGNSECYYPANSDNTDLEFTKENVQFMIHEVVECAYYSRDDEETQDGIWYNWNYMHDLMNRESISVKENDDLAHLITEAVGRRAQMYAKPVLVSKSIPDEIEVPEGEERYVEQRFTDLGSALQQLNNENADYYINISRSESITLDADDFTGKFRNLEIHLCDMAEDQMIYYNSDTLNLNGNVRIHAGSFQFNADSVNILTDSDERVEFGINVRKSGKGNVSYQKEKVDFWADQDKWEGIIENGDQEKIDNAIQILDNMLNPGMETGKCDSKTVASYVENILKAINGVDKFNDDFESVSNLGVGRNNPIWHTKNIDDEQETEIFSCEEWTDILIEALGESYGQWFGKNMEGNYDGTCNGPLESYIQKKKDAEEITPGDKENVIHSLMWWLREVVYEYNAYADYKSKLNDFLESKDEAQFKNTLTVLLNAMASDTIDGNDRPFIGMFDGSTTDMWETKKEEEPDWIQEITLHLDNIPFKGMFEIYEEYKDTPENEWRFKDFSYEDASVITTYNTLSNVVEMVYDFAEIAREAAGLKDLVNVYYDVIHSAYADSQGDNDGFDRSKVQFSTEDLGNLDAGISSLSGTKIASDHIRYWKDECNQDVSFPEQFTQDNVIHLTRNLAETMYYPEHVDKEDYAILCAKKEGLGWVYRAAEIMIRSIIDANYRYETYHGMNYAQGEIDEIKQAVENFYALSANASREAVSKAYSDLLNLVQEDRRNEHRTQEIKEMLENGQTAEFATYLAQMVVGWHAEEGFADRLPTGNDYESVDSALEDLIGNVEWVFGQYELVGQEKDAIKDFITCCKEILPKVEGTEWGELDISNPVSQTTLNKLNQDLAKVLSIFGGDDYVNNWNNRDDQTGGYPVSGVNETLTQGLTKDNVKTYLWDIAVRIYQITDEETKPYAYFDWNYVHEVLNKDIWTIKEYRDIAELIVESIGWRVDVVKHPYELVTRTSNGETYRRFDTLELALKEVTEGNTDYTIRISKAETANLSFALLTSCNYHSLELELCDLAQEQKFYYTANEFFPVNGELIFRGKSIEFGGTDSITIVSGGQENAVLSMDVREGTGNLRYDKKKVSVDVNKEIWKGKIDNGDGEHITEAIKKLDTLLNTETDQTIKISLVKGIISELAETEEFSYIFEPDNIVSSSLSEKVWTYSKTGKRVSITVKEDAFDSQDLIQAIVDEVEDTLTKNEDGKYDSELGDYLTKLKNCETFTDEEKHDGLDSFMWWFDRVLLMSNNYKTWQTKLADIQSSSNEADFISNMKSSLEALALESINGKDKLFFGDFEGSAEESGLWTTMKTEEPYFENVSFSWNSLLSAKVFNSFQNDMAHPSEDSWDYVKYDTEKGSITGVYKAMGSFIWAVMEYQKNARAGIGEDEPTETPVEPSTETPIVPGGGGSTGGNVNPTEIPSVSATPEEPVTIVVNKGNKTITTTITVEKDPVTGEVTKTEIVVETNKKTKKSTQSTTITTTLENGNTKTSAETKIMNSKGKVTSTVSINTIVDVKTGMEIEVKEEKDSKGNVTDSEATITPGAESLVHGKTIDIALKFQLENVLELTSGIKTNAKMEFSINISGEKIREELKKSSAGNVNAFIEIPKEFKDNKNVKDCKVTLDKEVLKEAKKSGRSLKVAIGDGSASEKTACEWTFSKKALQNAKKLKDLDLSMDIQKPKADRNTGIGKIFNSLKNDNSKTYKQLMKNSLVCSFGDNGELGCDAEVNMYVGDYATQNVPYYLYYANPKTNKLEKMPCKPAKVKNGFLSAKLKHCSEYVITDKKLPDDVATPLEDQITGIASSKKIEKGKSFVMKPVLPSTLSKVKKITRKDGADMQVVITYKSSDKSIATVGKNSGKITGKHKGTCIITTNILLADGSKKTVKTKVSVK